MRSFLGGWGWLFGLVKKNWDRAWQLNLGCFRSFCEASQNNVRLTSNTTYLSSIMWSMRGLGEGQLSQQTV